MTAELTQVGLGTLSAILLLREVRSILKDRENAKTGNGLDAAIRKELQPYLERNQEALQAIRDNTTKLAIVAERFWR